jgi:hypothetical protein
MASHEENGLHMAVMLRVILALRMNRASCVCGETKTVIRIPAVCVADSGEGAGDAPKMAAIVAALIGFRSN